MYTVEKVKCINCGEIFQTDNEDDLVLQLCADCQDTSDNWLLGDSGDSPDDPGGVV